MWDPLGYCSKFCQELPALTMTEVWGGASENPLASDSLSIFLWLSHLGSFVESVPPFKMLYQIPWALPVLWIPGFSRSLLGVGGKMGWVLQTPLLQTPIPLFWCCVCSLFVYMHVYMYRIKPKLWNTTVEAFIQSVWECCTHLELCQKNRLKMFFRCSCSLLFFCYEWMMMNTPSHTRDICVLYSVMSL